MHQVYLAIRQYNLRPIYINFYLPYFLLQTAAIVEESYITVACFTKFIESFNYHKIIYLVFSPLLFALAHWEQGIDGLISNLMFGFIFCLFYMKLKNLWPLVTGHFIVDYIYFS